MKWKLTIKVGKSTHTMLYPAADWILARNKTPRYSNESDLEYRCRAWSAFTGLKVVDYESED
jgi:hypothetical protein